MIGVKVKVTFDKQKVLKAVRKASFTSLSHAAAAIRQTAARSIREGKKPSAPGKPPRTRGKRRLKNSIRYAVDERKQLAIIGPDSDIAGNVGAAHEFGGQYRDENYPARPFMAPALHKNEQRLPDFWEKSIKP
jgi:phage gpG-like protein